MRRPLSQPLVADDEGKVFELDGYAPVGMKAGRFFRLEGPQLSRVPSDSELFVLPERAPMVWDDGSSEAEVMEKDPFSGDPVYPVAVFLPPGFTATHTVAFTERQLTGGKCSPLPLFSYAPAVYREDGIYSTYVRTDTSSRHALDGMDIEKVSENVESFRALLPDNRLLRHLENCALRYGCPAAKNFFLGRFEAPLPISPLCNIACLGCISYQETISCCQERISFTPEPREVGELAVHHLENTDDAVVSFGQGCEGEPLMVPEVLERAIKDIRSLTERGMVNLNTNATRPDIIARLFDAGLDSIRVSVNSFQEDLYRRYIRAEEYPLEVVLDSMRRFHDKGGFVSVNYLVFPGLTDSGTETEAFFRVLDEGVVDMIQWRNLNIDPLLYGRKLRLRIPPEEMSGLDRLVDRVKVRYPSLMNGYFNPSRGDIETFKRTGKGCRR